MFYYLLSSLPYLTQESEIFPAADEFLELCAEQMVENDFKKVSSARIDRYEEMAAVSGIAGRWARMEMALRNEIARERARKTNLAYEAFDAEGASWYRERIAQVFQNPSPFMAEKLILGIRFEMLSELESGYFFALENVIAYFLKVQLLERMKRMNKAQGEKSFSAAYQTIQAPLNNEGGLSVGV